MALEQSRALEADYCYDDDNDDDESDIHECIIRKCLFS